MRELLVDGIQLQTVFETGQLVLGPSGIKVGAGRNFGGKATPTATPKEALL